MTGPMTDAEIEALRTMPFTTSVNVGCGVFATDEERNLHRLAVEHYNAKLQVIAELTRVRAEIRRLRARAERDRVQLVNAQGDLLDIRGHLSPNGHPSRVPMELGERVAPAVEWLLARVDTLEAEAAKDCEDCPGNSESHRDTLGSLHMEQQSHAETRRVLGDAQREIERIRTENAELHGRDDWDGCSYAAEIHEREA